jgi:DNA replication protein DnaC
MVAAGATQVAQPCSCRHLEQRLAVFNAASIPAAVA